ncbi:hypothetical protein L7F22_049856 [Adiantum nelumboides]|nr:hypothetical protein [Adiantum nelumboides]
MVSSAPQPTPQMTSPVGTVGPAPSTIVHHTGLTAATTISMEPSTSTPTPRTFAPQGITHFMSRVDKLLQMECSATLSIADAINSLHGAQKMHAVTYESVYEKLLDTHQRVYDRDVEKAAFFDRNRILNRQVKDLKEVISSLNLQLCEAQNNCSKSARFVSIVGDFNNWQHRKNAADRKQPDDFKVWRLVVEDRLREGQEEDVWYQEYNYKADFDLGDENPDIDSLLQRANDEYWEPGEDEYMYDRHEQVANEVFKAYFGSHETVDPYEKGSLHDLEKLSEEAERRVKALKASHCNDKLPPTDVVFDTTYYNKSISKRPLQLVDDPVWRERVLAKKPPLAYWKHLIKGRKAWQEKYVPGIPHGGRYRIYLHTNEGPMERISPWSTYVLPDPDGGRASSIYWEPPPREIFLWQHKSPARPKSLRIYECHVGISSSEAKISTFNEFTDNVLPYIKHAGYNTIQLFGVQEHGDYSTAGYKVTGMFAISSRFGEPEDFKRLVDTAHGNSLA